MWPLLAKGGISYGEGVPSPEKAKSHPACHAAESGTDRSTTRCLWIREVHGAWAASSDELRRQAQIKSFSRSKCPEESSFSGITEGSDFLLFGCISFAMHEREQCQPGYHRIRQPARERLRSVRGRKHFPPTLFFGDPFSSFRTASRGEQRHPPCGPKPRRRRCFPADWRTPSCPRPQRLHDLPFLPTACHAAGVPNIRDSLRLRDFHAEKQP